MINCDQYSQPIASDDKWDKQIREWERQEEQREFSEASHVANNNLWLRDDGTP